MRENIVFNEWKINQNPRNAPVTIDNGGMSPQMIADLNAYYDWLEQASGEQELPEDQMS